MSQDKSVTEETLNPEQSKGIFVFVEGMPEFPGGQEALIYQLKKASDIRRNV